MSHDLMFQLVEPTNSEVISLISSWYHSEWKIPVQKSQQRITTIAQSETQFQVVATVDNVPIGTAGVYHHVGLIDKQPRFGVHKNWLAFSTLSLSSESKVTVPSYAPISKPKQPDAGRGNYTFSPIPQSAYTLG